MLHKRCSIPVGVATYAVGIVVFEGAVFGLMMLAVLVVQREQWIQYLGSDIHASGVNTITGLTLIGIVVVVAAAIIDAGKNEQPRVDDFSNCLVNRYVQSNREHSNSTSIRRDQYIRVLL